MYPGLVPTLMEEMGNDIVIMAGGGIHGHPQGTIAGAKAFRQAIDAVMQGIPLSEAAKDKPELKTAIEVWGIFKRPVFPYDGLYPKYPPKLPESAE
jgi:2,3-diketo-5-methylthiopentyl-1-phosphate enolase